MSNNVPPSLSNFTQPHCSESWITITQLNHLQVTVTTPPPHLPQIIISLGSAPGCQGEKNEKKKNKNNSAVSTWSQKSSLRVILLPGWGFGSRAGTSCCLLYLARSNQLTAQAMDLQHAAGTLCTKNHEGQTLALHSSGSQERQQWEAS